jgi:26S proteasome regulatory subunit N7
LAEKDLKIKDSE